MESKVADNFRAPTIKAQRRFLVDPERSRIDRLFQLTIDRQDACSILKGRCPNHRNHQVAKYIRFKLILFRCLLFIGSV